ncbi:MAG TPA: orotidine-5'-phosphate decarboxylase [Solirubrobacteraceae bacterium]|nr:orotidine-5'-phosphate decarboxylase [Solirubrobacteraceae bacterium]
MTSVTVGDAPGDAGGPTRGAGTVAGDAGGRGGTARPVAESFGDRLAGRVASRGSQIVLGLDPDPARLWPQAIEAAGGGDATPVERAAMAVAVHCRLVIEAAGEHCVAVKLQLACFERLGAPGWAALEDVAAAAHERGLLVIADAKRGDIDVSAAAYGQAFFGGTPTPFGPVAGLGADALTVNPLLGRDSLAPLVGAARASCGGLFALVRTSNPGAADVQEQELAAGGSVSTRLAAIVTELGADGIGASGLADVGAVVGATAPARLEMLRETMPHAVFLLPGVGAQGGRVEDLAAAFVPGPAAGLIAVSRSVVSAHERAGGRPSTAAAAEAARLRELAWGLCT